MVKTKRHISQLKSVTLAYLPQEALGHLMETTHRFQKCNCTHRVEQDLVQLLRLKSLFHGTKWEYHHFYQGAQILLIFYCVTQPDVEPPPASEFDCNIKLNGNFLWLVAKLSNNVFLIQTKFKKCRSNVILMQVMFPEL